MQEFEQSEYSPLAQKRIAELKTQAARQDLRRLTMRFFAFSWPRRSLLVASAAGAAQAPDADVAARDRRGVRAAADPRRCPPASRCASSARRIWSRAPSSAPATSLIVERRHRRRRAARPAVSSSAARIASASTAASAARRASSTGGWIRIVAVNESTAIAAFEHICGAVGQGDYLEPFVAPVVPAGADRDETPGEPDFTSLGQVVVGNEDRSDDGASATSC